MVDVHTHILPFVDDGSDSVANSIKIVKEYLDLGVNHFIFTPHYRKDEYEPSVDLLRKVFNEFTSELKAQNVNANCYLGEEVFCDSNIYSLLDENKVLTINNSKYVLLEFNYTAYTDIADYVYNLTCLGYKPIIAHVERYEYLNRIEDYYDLVESGALLQVNASSLVTPEYKKSVINLIKENLVTFIASDVHYSRKQCFLEAYKFVSKKFSKQTAAKLFSENAKNLLLN